MTTVVKGDVIHNCMTEEQLKSFLEDGYKVMKEEPKTKEEPKAAPKKAARGKEK